MYKPGDLIQIEIAAAWRGVLIPVVLPGVIVEYVKAYTGATRWKLDLTLPGGEVITEIVCETELKPRLPRRRPAM